jgi:hypothetical protein
MSAAGFIIDLLDHLNPLSETSRPALGPTQPPLGPIQPPLGLTQSASGPTQPPLGPTQPPLGPIQLPSGPTQPPLGPPVPLFNTCLGYFSEVNWPGSVAGSISSCHAAIKNEWSCTSFYGVHC